MTTELHRTNCNWNCSYAVSFQACPSPVCGAHSVTATLHNLLSLTAMFCSIQTNVTTDPSSKVLWDLQAGYNYPHSTSLHICWVVMWQSATLHFQTNNKTSYFHRTFHCMTLCQNLYKMTNHSLWTSDTLHKNSGIVLSDQYCLSLPVHSLVT
jgi:hypothetical protein